MEEVFDYKEYKEEEYKEEKKDESSSVTLVFNTVYATSHPVVVRIEENDLDTERNLITAIVNSGLRFPGSIEFRAVRRGNQIFSVVRCVDEIYVIDPEGRLPVEEFKKWRGQESSKEAFYYAAVWRAPLGTRSKNGKILKQLGLRAKERGEHQMQKISHTYRDQIAEHERVEEVRQRAAAMARGGFFDRGVRRQQDIAGMCFLPPGGRAAIWAAEEQEGTSPCVLL